MKFSYKCEYVWVYKEKYGEIYQKLNDGYLWEVAVEQGMIQSLKTLYPWAMWEFSNNGLVLLSLQKKESVISTF